MERYARRLTRQLGVEIETYGFDMGDQEGLPEAKDPRDMPYFWKPGFYKLDVEKLNARIKTSKLVLGDVKETCKTFIEKYDPAPMAACFIDVDYYSSTRDLLALFEADDLYHLPRVICYFDDVDVANPFIGELAAIGEFNDAHYDRKFGHSCGHHERVLFGMYSEQVFTFHNFKHPKYNIFAADYTIEAMPLTRT